MSQPQGALSVVGASGVWPAARTGFRRLARRRIGADLDGLHVRGLESARLQSRLGPVVFAVTHVAWWDVLVLLCLDEAIGSEGRAWMDAENLERLTFFRWCGAIPIDRSRPGRARAGIREAAQFLSAPERVLWVFPQGRQRPPGRRPLGLEGGLEVVARQSGAAVVPVALAYGFRHRDVPAAVVHFGTALAASAADRVVLEAALEVGLRAIDGFLDGEDEAFTTLIPPTRAIPGEGLASRWLARLAQTWP